MEKWQRKTFLKPLRVCLQELVFRPSKVSKLITAGEFMAVQLKDIEGMTDEWCRSTEELEQIKQERLAYLQSYGVSGLYQIARMNWEGQVHARHSYTISEGKPLAVRELERLRSRYPAEKSGRTTRKTKLKKSVVEE